jgi:hypothetical protein
VSIATPDSQITLSARARAALADAIHEHAKYVGELQKKVAQHRRNRKGVPFWMLRALGAEASSSVQREIATRVLRGAQLRVSDVEVTIRTTLDVLDADGQEIGFITLEDNDGCEEYLAAGYDAVDVLEDDGWSAADVSASGASVGKRRRKFYDRNGTARELVQLLSDGE